MFSFKYTVVLSMVGLATVTNLISADELCGTGSDAVWRRHPSNCSSLYICVLGRQVLYPLCPADHVIAADDKTCVPTGSTLDECTTTAPVIHSEDHLPNTCKLGETTPNQASCARYSECVTMGKDSMAKVEMECPFPMLFDSSSGKCDHYKNVKCQPGQLVPRSQCDYEANQCKTAQCVPCHIRFPSCTGKPDGLNTWSGKEWTPFFLICGEERVLYQGQCKSEKEVQIFHPHQKTCVPYDDKANYKQ